MERSLIRVRNNHVWWQDPDDELCFDRATGRLSFEGREVDVDDLVAFAQVMFHFLFVGQLNVENGTLFEVLNAVYSLPVSTVLCHDDRKVEVEVMEEVFHAWSLPHACGPRDQEAVFNKAGFEYYSCPDVDELPVSLQVGEAPVPSLVWASAWVDQV